MNIPGGHPPAKFWRFLALGAVNCFLWIWFNFTKTRTFHPQWRLWCQMLVQLYQKDSAGTSTTHLKIIWLKRCMFDLTFLQQWLDYGNTMYARNARLKKLISPEKWMSITNGLSDIFSMGPLGLPFVLNYYCHCICIFLKTYDLYVWLWLLLQKLQCQPVTIRS